MKCLTDRQAAILAYISAFIKEHSYPPTIREIAQQFSISVKGAYDHVRALVKKEKLRLGKNRSRALELIEAAEVDPEIASVPLLGYVAAGRPILAQEDINETIVVPCSLTRSRECFALVVRGDSMKDAGILNNDVVIVAQQQHADNGEIIVALIDEAATLKRFYREKTRFKLVAENPEFAPIYTQDVRILGKLAGVIRRY